MGKVRGNGEGTVYYNDSKGYWVGQCTIGFKPDGKLNRKTVYGKTEKEAIKKIKKLQRDVQELQYVEKNSILLVKVMEDAREDKLALNLISGGQYARIGWTIKKIKESRLGTMKIQSIKAEDVQNFLNDNKDLSNSYIKQLYSQFTQAFSRAIKKGYIVKDPMIDVIKPKSNNENKNVRSLTIEEQKALTDYLNFVSVEKEKYKNAFLIQMYMGLRIGEVLALTNDCIDLEKKILYVNKTLSRDKKFLVSMKYRTKGRDGAREVPIPESMVKVLEEQIEISKYNKDGLLFLCNGNYVVSTSLNAVLKRIFSTNLQMPKSKDVSTHYLRHTYGTRCIEAGMSPVVVQRLMGHTDVKITLNTYTSVFNSFKLDELKKVEEYLKRI